MKYLLQVLLLALTILQLHADGLTGKYYDNNNFTDYKFSRVDSSINFEWGSGRPSGLAENDTFSIEWSGWIYIPQNSTYIFSLAHDDGMILTIDGSTLYDKSTWTGGSYNYGTTTGKYFSAGYYPIELKFVEESGGAYAKLSWENTNSIGTRTIISSAHLFTAKPNLADLGLTEKTSPSPLIVDLDENITIPITLNNIGTLDVNTSTILAITYSLDINVSEITPATDFNCSMSSGLLSAGSPITCTRTTDITAGTTDLDFTFIVKSQEYGELIQTSVVTSASSEINSINNTLNSPSVRVAAPGFCQKNGLSEGFHIVDPDGGDDENSYEIYCDMTSTKAPRELISLPLKNDYNNIVFEDDAPSSNYYAEAENAKNDAIENSFNYIQIEISGGLINVVPSSIAEGSTNEGYFSNINLIGTPFAIDWDNTTLSNCDVDKLRIGSFDQAVKINTLDYTNGRCKVESMQLILLDEYKYLTYPDIQGTNGTYGDEILEETCRQIFEKVPDDATHLPTLSGASNGYFWIDPDQGGRVSTDSVTTLFRPFVAYCKFQEDIGQAWTFVMALDAKVTNSKNDIKTLDEVRANPNIYHDTCSQLGLLFFVPNVKDTFQRTRDYLADNKQEWINYTGTIREKYQMYTNNPDREYYIPGEGYNEIWPYGPFGVYQPYGGNKDINGNSLTWRSASGDTSMGGGSGRCMNSGVASGANECTDYTQRLAGVTNDDGTLGAIGWRTTLMDQVDAGLQGITNGDQWWVADVGAGEYLHNKTAANGTPECSITSPGSNAATADACDRTYYEPNGNYTANAWLNFISDSNGNVYHNDDNNAFYSYYDYMCMSWDNYFTFERYGLTEGPFTVIEHDNPIIDTTGGYPITTPSDLNITTKVVNEPKDFDMLLLSDNRAQIVDDQNVSAGLFLVELEEVSGENTVTDLKYYGQIGQSNDFNLDSNPRGVVLLNDALAGVTNAHQRLVFQFKYCAYDDVWGNCWNITGSGTNTKATCATGYDSLGYPNSPCKIAESNDFALRPKKFGLSSTDGILIGSTLIVKADEVNINYIAEDNNGAPTEDYNVYFSNLNTDITLESAGFTCSTSFLEDTNQSTYQFQDGIDTHATTLSDVGVYNFLLQEIPGQEYALVDALDTPDSERYITPNDITLTIKPDHFRISTIPNVNRNTDGNFTYLAKDTSLDNMSAKLKFTVTAENHLDARTLNYTDSCYASNFNLDVNYTVPVGTANASMYYKIKDKNNVDVTLANNEVPSTDLSFIQTGDTVSKALFTNDVHGSAEVVVLFNFGREVDTAVNPFTINLSNLNVSDQSTAMIVNTTNQVINQDATFVYGRVAGPKRPTYTNCVDNPTNCTSGDESARIVFQIYKDNLGPVVPALNGATHDGTQDSRWWTSPFHDKDNILTDGNITTPSNQFVTEVTGANATQSALVEESNFRYRIELNYNGNDGYIKEGNFKHYPSSWLIYDPDNNAATFNTFKYNFITEGWSGKHESSTSSTTKAANRTSKRIIW